ncbi:aminobutyraldehyde dehydrogenase [Arthrobacter sp. ISL-30]|uniref:aminobutyraldehyde dehydrogenase n=1 Tax=Arthrobacter sp. ISL-30 TaxID=2819109 RepID=UPI001BE8950E|nr:aminobutyraldehyde dehydrogenase [Arthrobacter sp. ISL-30]MBT2515676.1 aminobutyraldehyde dehydrogenase [Arthrobacter sp. ISL-30]
MTSTATTTSGTVRRATEPTPILAIDKLPPGQHFISGEFRAGAGNESQAIVDPCTEAVICEVAQGTAADADAAVGAALEAKESWSRTLPKQRAEILLAIADRLADNADLLSRLEALNTGKPLMVAEDDVASSIDSFRFMAGAARVTTSLAAGEYAEDHLSVILREPLGVVGVVTPWNYPLLMAVWKIAPILAAGNTIVLKPSEQTPLTTLKFAELTADLLPPGVLNIVTGLGPVIGARLAEHPDVDMIALTGSVNSGRAVARVASETVKRVHLELGGKAPVVIFADADLAAAAESLRVAGYWNSGQECGAGCRVLVHESVADRFTQLLVEQVSTLVVGEPTAGADVEIGPMISKAHFERVLGHLERAQASGAKAVLGGGALEGSGYFVAPTVLADVPEDAACTLEEIFGPVVTVETFSTENEAVTRANQVPYGLAASVWTLNPQLGHDVASRLEAGTVWVNSHLVLATEMPWGGFKSSGYGRDLSAYALDDYSRTKHVMHNKAR